ncbi:hypothetical protein Mgra_00007113 [Meloidogyne graminicola]|uniref:Uncharacterized protein n=1 Tax=Meloidogyne graminicola TaxID=189291 RepID=A0A8S9ZJ91_9BILA|nr:hypothetical protein Mgra_00007113 [Meloidogyne graminicola]
MDEEKLDILINNAVIMFYPLYEKTIDGQTWQSNQLENKMNRAGHFLLTELLLPKLERSEEGGRIVNVSSSLHLLADNVDPEIVDSPQHFGIIRLMHPKSNKLNNALASKVTANAFHPGSVDTSLFRAEFYQKYLKTIVSLIVWFLLIFLKLLKMVLDSSLLGFDECKESKKVHPLASDHLACEILYNNSLEQCVWIVQI